MDTDEGQPAIDYRYVSDGVDKGAGTPEHAAIVGFIDPVTQPFCERCDRLRLTADGQFRNCLFSTTEWDARQVLREGGCGACRPIAVSAAHVVTGRDWTEEDADLCE